MPRPVIVHATDLPRCLLVIAPRPVITDELRMARLEAYLGREFPDLNFVLSEDARMAGARAAAGIMPHRDGSPPFDPVEGEAVLHRVLDAVNLFAAYGTRVH